MPEIKYVTVVDGCGGKARIPKAGLEQYKKQQQEFRKTAQQAGLSPKQQKLYEIAEIIEE